VLLIAGRSDLSRHSKMALRYRLRGSRNPRPKYTPMSLSSLLGAPTKATQYHNPPTPFDRCTTRVIGFRNAAEFYAPLMEYLIQTNRPHNPLRASDFDYEKWFIDMQGAMNFDLSCESLQYRPLLGGPVYVRNPIEWHCAISEMTSTGQIRLDFEIIKLVPTLQTINRSVSQYDARQNLMVEPIASKQIHTG
jgi:hypothetical protein